MMRRTDFLYDDLLKKLREEEKESSLSSKHRQTKEACYDLPEAKEDRWDTNYLAKKS